MEHCPEVLSGWPNETTVWSATLAKPPFTPWPDGYGEVSSNYATLVESGKSEETWKQAVKDMGYEVLDNPRLPRRALAIRAGLGVSGLFGPLITPLHGSFVYIGTIVVRMAPPDGANGPEHDRSPGCERCGNCIDACPTGAITSEGLNHMKCLRMDMSNTDNMPEEHYSLMGRRIMGCDACQRVCPHNCGIIPETPSAEVIAPFKLEALLSEPDIDAISARITASYTNKTRIQIQSVLAAANTGRSDLLPYISKFADDEDGTLRRASRWAIERLS
jgi:epoxyqueuosine reductase